MVAGLFCLNKAAREKHKHISLFFCFFFHSIFFFKTSRLLATRPDVFLVAQNLLFFMHFWQERMLVAPPEAYVGLLEALTMDYAYPFLVLFLVGVMSLMFGHSLLMLC